GLGHRVPHGASRRVPLAARLAGNELATDGTAGGDWSHSAAASAGVDDRSAIERGDPGGDPRPASAAAYRLAAVACEACLLQVLRFCEARVAVARLDARPDCAGAA